MPQDTGIVDDGDLRHYRIEIPNSIDDSDLDPYEFRIYAHLKRRAGDAGRCTEGTRRMAEHCKMSPPQVVKVKRSLEAKGLIQIRKGDPKTQTPDLVVIVNIWRENLDRYTPAATVHVVAHPVHVVAHPVHVVAQKKEQEQERTNQEPSANAEGTAHKTRRPPRKLESDPRSHHPAIEAVRLLMSRNPEILLYDELIATIGAEPDIGKLAACRKAWVKAGYNVNALTWALEWYANGIPERNGNGTNQQQPRSRTQYGKPAITRDYSKFPARTG